MPRNLQSVQAGPSRSNTSPSNTSIATDEQLGLTSAFEQFIGLSSQLSQSYRQLEHRVCELTAELGVASADRLKALEDKERLADRLEKLLHVLPAGVVVLNEKGCISDCNPAAFEMLGNPKIGEPWREVIKRCFAPRGDDGHEVSTFDGRRIHIATRSLEEEGQIVLLTDNTETRRLQTELNRRERLSSMGKMVSALAHQIRTPLSAALLYANHLCNDSLQADKRRQFSQKLLARLHHLEQQVGDMLLFVRGDVSLNDQISLANLQQVLADAIETTLQEKHIHCRWQNTDPQIQLRCNREVLVGALTNLVDNAVQASGCESQLLIEMRRADQCSVSIAVHDNGPGIEQHNLAAVQEAFVTTKAQGIGLGLAVVNVVANAHGGRFALKPRVGGGISAELLLPIQQPHANSIN